ncbi:MAG: helix-turn-helix transcriptional regulator [Chitinophagaceae bacterium]|nr:helix-turn-helix transcriptional regulator [Chitinophagaceae bacterium]
MYTVRKLIKEIRKEANLTQTEFARVLEVSPVLIAMVETGQKEVSKNFIEKLADKMGVHPASITPFFFTNVDSNTTLSPIEKKLLFYGEKMQEYLIKIKAKKLRI